MGFLTVFSRYEMSQKKSHRFNENRAFKVGLGRKKEIWRKYFSMQTGCASEKWVFWLEVNIKGCTFVPNRTRTLLPVIQVRADASRVKARARKVHLSWFPLFIYVVLLGFAVVQCEICVRWFVSIMRSTYTFSLFIASNKDGQMAHY